MTAPIARVRKILLVRTDRLGDMVLTLPAFQAVRRQWPRAHVVALVSAYTAPLLSLTRYVDEVIVDDPADSTGDLARRLRPMGFEAALVFNSNLRNCLAVRCAGIPRRVTWAYKAPGLLLGNYRVALHRTHPPVHESEFALAFVRKLGAPRSGPTGARVAHRRCHARARRGPHSARAGHQRAPVRRSPGQRSQRVQLAAGALRRTDQPARRATAAC